MRHLFSCRNGLRPCSCPCEDRTTSTVEGAAALERLLAEQHDDDHGPSCRCTDCLEDRR